MCVLCDADACILVLYVSYIESNPKKKKTVIYHSKYSLRHSHRIV